MRPIPWLLALAVAFPASLFAARAAAQIVTDGSVGERVQIDDPDATIPASLGRQAGPNLFHSFEAFAIRSGGSATFTPDGLDEPVENVVSRVTGGAPSTLRGTLRSTIGESRFLFVNPAGVVFGEGARVDVGGDFYGSTAHEIGFSDGDWPTREASSGSLSSAPPEAFGFLDAEIARIEVDGGVLSVSPGRRLGLVGGDLAIRGGADGFLSAPDGALQLVGVGSAGSVRGLDGDALELGLVGFAELGDVLAFDDAILSSSGLRPDFAVPTSLVGPVGDCPGFCLARIVTEPFEPGDVPLGEVGGVPFALRPQLQPTGAGEIWIRARDLTVLDSDVRAVTAGTDAGRIAIELDGDLLLRKEQRPENVGVLARTGGVEVVGDVFIVDPVAGQLVTFEDVRLVLGGPGRGADVVIAARDASIEDGARITTTSQGPGPGGSVRIDARGTVAIRGTDNDPERTPSAVFASAESSGDAGDIELRAGLLTLSEDGSLVAQTSGDADGGNITVEVGRVEILDTSEIDTSTSAFALAPGEAGPTVGNAGNVHVIARESVLISGRESALEFARLRSFSNERTAGRAGTVRVETPLLRIEDGGGISVRTRGSGAGGNVELRVSRLEMEGGEILAESTSSGLAGDIDVEAGDRVTLLDSSINARAPDSDGGNVSLRATQQVFLRASSITSSVGAGTGGNIDIDPELVVLDNGNVVAQAITGSGGSIQVSGRFLFANPESLISASSQLGVSGTVVARSPESDVGEGLAVLRSDWTEGAHLLRELCDLRGGTADSSLIVTGRDAPPITPEHRARVRLAQAGGGPWDALLIRIQALWLRGELARALELSRSVVEAPDGVVRARALGLRARIEQRRERFARARADSDLALAEARELGKPELVAALELDRANFHAQRAETAAAREHYERARATAPGSDAARLAALERALLDADELGPAVHALEAAPPSPERTLGLLRAGLGLPHDAPLERARVWSEAARSAHALGELRLASWGWGLLADPYRAQGRTRDALELNRRALEAARAANAPEAEQRWQLQGGALLDALGQPERALASYRAAVDGLATLRASAAVAGARQAAFARELPLQPALTALVESLLRNARAAAPEQRQALLREARDRLEDARAVEIQDWFEDDCVAGRRRATPESLPGAVVIYPIVLEELTELLVALPSRMTLQRVPIDRAALGAELRRFRALLEKRTTREYRVPAARLYDWLLRPLEDEIEAASPDVLVFAPWGPFRGVPMAALFDDRAGEFLIEKYAVAVTPGLSLIEPRALAPQRLRLLKAGLTEGVQGFPPLPWVARELEQIGDELGGETLLDSAFVSERLRTRIVEEPLGVIHVASHGEFGTRAEDAFLLAWDKKLAMNDLADWIRSTAGRDRPLELLTLSACQTAAGDERASLGMAGLAVRAGARSTLATLWSINDAATAELVGLFYRHLAREGSSRAEALRRAQLGLLGRRGSEHPGYWAPFLLIGTWL